MEEGYGKPVTHLERSRHPKLVTRHVLVDQFENSLRGGVASSRTDLGQPRIAAVSILKPGADIVEEMLNQILAIQKALADQNLRLLQFGLAKKRLDRPGAGCGMSDQNLSCLATRIERVLAGVGNQLLDEALQ